jgi:hypothetical protein
VVEEDILELALAGNQEAMPVVRKYKRGEDIMKFKFWQQKPVKTHDEIRESFNKTLAESTLTPYGIEQVIRGLIQVHLKNRHLHFNPRAKRAV